MSHFFHDLSVTIGATVGFAGILLFAEWLVCSERTQKTVGLRGHLVICALIYLCPFSLAPVVSGQTFILASSQVGLAAFLGSAKWRKPTIIGSAVVSVLLYPIFISF